MVKLCRICLIVLRRSCEVRVSRLVGGPEFVFGLVPSGVIFIHGDFFEEFVARLWGSWPSLIEIRP